MMHARKWQRELSRFELILVVILIATLTGFTLNKTEHAFARAEQAHVRATVANLNTHLNIIAFQSIIQRKYDFLDMIQGSNPMNIDEIIHKKTIIKVNKIADANSSYVNQGKYLGELASVGTEDVPGGFWYFNTKSRFLVYKVDNLKYFQSTLAGSDRIRFYVDVQFTDKNANGKFDAGVDAFEQISLKSQDVYKWTF